MAPEFVARAAHMAWQSRMRVPAFKAPGSARAVSELFAQLVRYAEAPRVKRTQAGESCAASVFIQLRVNLRD